MQSVKKQLEQKQFKEKQLDKSKGLLEDYSIRKSVNSREIVSNKIYLLDLLSKGSLGTDGSGKIIEGTATGAVVPVGAIIAWLKTYTNTPNLPSNFVECNGQVLSNGSSPYDTQTIPDLNGAISGIKTFLRGNTTSGGAGGATAHNHDISAYGATITGLSISGTTDGPSSTIEVASGCGVSVADTSHTHTLSCGVTGSGTIDLVACDGISSEYHQPPYYDVVWIMRVL